MRHQQNRQHLDAPAGSKLLNIIELPPVDISGLVDPDAKVVTRLAVMMREARPSIRYAISAMEHRPTIFIVDLFGTEAFEIADEFDMPKYVFATTAAWFVALCSYCQRLDKEMYHEFVRIGVEFSLSDGVLVNTWEDLERTSLKALRDHEIFRSVFKVPVYPVGPLRRSVEPGGSRSELLEWLNMQPSESVIYISFGSGGTMSAEQINELAWGLELSQQRFVWVARPPIEGKTDGSFFTAGNSPDGTPDYLPNGFLTRTRNVGVVVPLWAPQVEILSHPSVGGFLSHCGWNSILESIVSGVPMIAWPLYSEQKMNATLLTEELGMAVRPKVLPTKKVVGREEIEKMVRTVMEYKEGKGMREKVRELKYSGERAVSKGGSSYNSLGGLIKECEMKHRWHKAKVNNPLVPEVVGHDVPSEIIAPT
ncbi:hypothetical protein F0562_003818 [Nyssa sinensis]|uniref:Glycosyltransferase n=1 Tax=Nyssa sinensis TaxID=561372 RepID=A0A5J5BWS9_9ASTE|nr:hypothetical protein F0562_003818 [Nyssa sinensis]